MKFIPIIHSFQRRREYDDCAPDEMIQSSILPFSVSRYEAMSDALGERQLPGRVVEYMGSMKVFLLGKVGSHSHRR